MNQARKTRKKRTDSFFIPEAQRRRFRQIHLVRRLTVIQKVTDMPTLPALPRVSRGRMWK